jgi:hypothetical protein
MSAGLHTTRAHREILLDRHRLRTPRLKNNAKRRTILEKIGCVSKCALECTLLVPSLKKYNSFNWLRWYLAETEGFEPSIGLYNPITV